MKCISKCGECSNEMSDVLKPVVPVAPKPPKPVDAVVFAPNKLPPRVDCGCV